MIGEFRSECYCGNSLPKKMKREHEDDDIADCCSWTCAGQLNETCGGYLCNSVYTLNSTERKISSMLEMMNRSNIRKKVFAFSR